MPLAPGASFGRFRILRRLGAGAMGEVWLAEDPQIERRLAIKTVRVEGGGGAAEEDLRARLLQEAKAAGRLVHPHVVTLFEAGEIEGVFFLAFEHVAGSDLTTRMRRAPPPTVDEILRVGREAAAGLAAAHRRGIVHRDVKPSNLLLTEEGTVKISDFGIAKLVGARTDLTQSGSVIGTPQYLSPEQVRAEKLDGRSDLFSLGVVLYELLAGRRPFTGETLTTLVYEIVSLDPRPISELVPSLPPRLAGAVMRLLAKDREDRFPTAEALNEELAAAERELAEIRAGTTETFPSADGVGASPASQGDVATALLPGEPEAGRAGERKGPGRLPRLLRLGAPILLGLVMAGVAAVMVLQLVAGEEKGLSGAEEERSAVTTSAPEEPPEGEQVGNFDPRPEEERAGAVAKDAAEAMRRPETSPIPATADAPTPSRTVGGSVTFAITPPEAARRAVVKVDGLARGPATGSLLTFRPGEHRIEVLAAGFVPLTVLVESRPGGPERLELAMQRE